MIADKIKALLPVHLPITIGDLPSPNLEAIGLLEYDGSANTEYFGARSGSTVYSPILRVVLRSSSYPTLQSWVETIKSTLHRYHDDTFLSIMLVGSPMYLGRNEQKFHEFQIVFNISVKE